MKRALSSEEEAEWSEGESAWTGRLDSTRNTGGSFEPSMVAKSSHKSVMRKEVRNEVYPHDMNASEQSSESSDLQSIGDPEASDGEGGTSDDHLSNTLNTHNEISAQIHSNDEECEWSEGESAWATVGKFVWTPKINERLKQGLVCYKAQGWTRVAEYVGGQVTALQCRERMLILLHESASQQADVSRTRSKNARSDW